MKRSPKRALACWWLLVGLLGVVGCARHVVVVRDAGQVDADRSVTLLSEDEWTVRQEPGRAP